MNGHALGRQLLVEFFNCDPVLLNDVEFVKDKMQQAAILAGATVVGKVFHHFSPHGVSGVVVIAESHLAIHTWPEYCYAAVDLFTCGSEVNPYVAFDFLRESFRAERYESKEIERGLREAIGEPVFHKPSVAV